MLLLYDLYLLRMLSACRTMRDCTAIDYACTTYEELLGIERRYTGGRPSLTDHSHH